MSTFDGTEGGIISRQTAEIYLENYVKGQTYSLNLEIRGHYFGRNNIDALLAQEGAVGLRMYYGFKENGQSLLEPELVLVAVDSEGNDILDNNLIMDISQPCPPVCPRHGL